MRKLQLNDSSYLVAFTDRGGNNIHSSFECSIDEIGEILTTWRKYQIRGSAMNIYQKGDIYDFQLILQIDYTLLIYVGDEKILEAIKSAARVWKKE